MNLEQLPFDLLLGISENLDNKDLLNFMLINKRISKIKDFNKTSISFFIKRKEEYKLSKLENTLKRLCDINEEFNKYYALKDFRYIINNKKYQSRSYCLSGDIVRRIEFYPQKLYSIAYTLIQIYKCKNYDNEFIKSKVYHILSDLDVWIFRNIKKKINLEGFEEIEIKHLEDLI